MHHALIDVAFRILLLPTRSGTNIPFTFLGRDAFLLSFAVVIPLSSPIVVPLSSSVFIPLVVNRRVEAMAVAVRGVLSGIGGRATLDGMAHYRRVDLG